jgi:inosose dehydratase
MMGRDFTDPGLSRRGFAELAAGLGVAGQVAGQPGASRPAPPKPKKLKVGHTGITWPGGQEQRGIETAIRDIGGLGYHGLETFGDVLDKYEKDGGLRRYLEAANLPLISGYCTVDLVDPAKRTEGVARMTEWAKVIRKNGGRIMILGPSGRRGQADFRFSEHRADIAATLTEIAKAVMDQGVTGVLHPHTGTVVETLDETIAILDSVDTRYVKFGPDVGQIVKGGAEPAAVTKLVKDHLAIVQHMHLKDYSGGQYYLGYCPLGFGRVELAKLLDLMESKTEIAGMVMVELDGGRPTPMPPGEAARIAKVYLESQGIVFRA